MPGIEYPATRREDIVDVLHGVPVPDPYRWLEDDHAPETAQWIAAQNALTSAYLEKNPEREKIRRRLTELWNYEKFGVPHKHGSRYFFTRNDGLQNQSSLYWQESLDGEPRLLLDPNTLSSDGTVALSAYKVSKDGQYLAYSLSAAGSDWQEWRVRRVETGEDLPDLVQWSKFSDASWTADSSGFYYSRYDPPAEGSAYKGANYFQKLCFHRLGTEQAEDELVYERADQKEWGFGGSVTEDGRYLVISVWHGTFQENGILYQDLSRPGEPVVELLLNFDASYNFIGNVGARFFFHTNHSAPRYRIVAIDLERPAPEHWGEIVPESGDTLEQGMLAGGQIIALYLRDAHSLVKCFDLSGRFLRDVPLPALGTVADFSGEQDSSEAFFLYTDFATPPVVYHYDLQSGKIDAIRRPKLQHDPQQYTAEQVFYHSKDGTRVPMFLVYKKGLERSSQTPTLLHGYGGFNASSTPGFNPAFLAWMEMGGMYALANLRGGGEYGLAWHDGGKLHNKQNVFDDFIRAAEWLIENDYTSTPRLAIYGRSNGGLLTGACLTQRPDLFGAVVVTVGVLDMLRYHKWTIGWAWASDYGSPDEPDYFKTLLAYSPYHNIQPGTAYPPTLVTTGDHDDRVFPAHSFKFAAALQKAQAGPAPVLIRIDVRAGHGAGKPIAKLIAEWGDMLAFMNQALGLAGAPPVS